MNGPSPVMWASQRNRHGKKRKLILGRSLLYAYFVIPGQRLGAVVTSAVLAWPQLWLAGVQMSHIDVVSEQQSHCNQQYNVAEVQ